MGIADKIQRSNLDGSGVEDLVTELAWPQGIALDLVPVEAGPDLVVKTSVDDNTLTTGQSFTLRATVRNQGNASAAATTLRYYRSSNATISTDDTEVGTDGVGTLSAGATSDESISLNAPSAAGTYYYGACVDNVSSESNTDNNCSSAVAVTVDLATREYTRSRSFPADFSYDPLFESLGYRIASSDIDDGLLGVSHVDVRIQARSVSPWERHVTKVTFSYKLRVSSTIPSNTTLRATIVYEMRVESGCCFSSVVETYTVSLVVVVGNDDSSSGKVIAVDAESSEQVHVQESLPRHPH